MQTSFHQLHSAITLDSVFLSHPHPVHKLALSALPSEYGQRWVSQSLLRPLLPYSSPPSALAWTLQTACARSPCFHPCLLQLRILLWLPVSFTIKAKVPTASLKACVIPLHSQSPSEPFSLTTLASLLFLEQAKPSHTSLSLCLATHSTQIALLLHTGLIPSPVSLRSRPECHFTCEGFRDHLM